MRLIITAAFIFLSSWVAVGQDYPSYPDHLTSGIQVEALDDTGLGAAPGTARRLLPLALELIKVFEDWIPDAYNDASNYCTIGYGHLLGKKPCADMKAEIAAFNPPLSIEAGVELLDKDTALSRLAVQRLTRDVRLSDEQFGALASFVFNVGAANFEKSTLLRFVKAGEFDAAAKQFGRWIQSKGKVLNGLIARRNCERLLFLGQLSARDDGKFYRIDCDGLGAAAPSGTPIDIETGE